MPILSVIQLAVVSTSLGAATQSHEGNRHSRPEYEFVGTLTTPDEKVDLRFGSIVPSMRPIVIEHGQIRPLNPHSSPQQREAAAGLKVIIDITQPSPDELTLRLDTTHTYYVGEKFPNRAPAFHSDYSSARP